MLAKDGADKNWTPGYIKASLGKRAKIIDDRLQGRHFVAGDRFTAADIAITYTLGLLSFLDITGGDASKAYYVRCGQRPACQRASTVQ